MSGVRTGLSVTVRAESFAKSPIDAMSSAEERVARYAVDLGALLKAARQSIEQMGRCATGRTATSTGPATIAKCTAEVHKLSTWLQKHQDEALRDKSKLIEIASLLFKFANDAFRQDGGSEDGGASSLFDQIVALHEVLMSLPEGKLVNSAGKSKVLRSLEALRGLENTGSRGGASSTSAADETMVTTWELLDIVPCATGRTVVLTVMNSSSGDDMEVVVEEDEGALTASLRQQFDEGAALVVQLEALPSSSGSGYRFRGFEAA